MFNSENAYKIAHNYIRLANYAHKLSMGKEEIRLIRKMRCWWLWADLLKRIGR